METPVGLEVAADERDYLVGFSELGGGVEGKADLGIGGYRVGVNAIVHNGDLCSKRLRKRAGLPVRGADAGIGDVKVQQVVEVLEAQPTGFAGGILQRKLGVKAHIGALGVVKEHAVNAKFCIGPDLL